MEGIPGGGRSEGSERCSSRGEWRIPPFLVERASRAVPVKSNHHFRVMPALVAGIHVFLTDLQAGKAWMAGTSPAMTPDKTPQHWGAALKLSFRSELHVGRIEAQLDVLLGAEISGRHGDADGVLRFDVLTEQIVLETERTYEVHDFWQIGLRGERKRVLGGVEHPRGLELGFEAGEVGAGRLRHRVAGRLALVALVLHKCNRFIPDADQRLAEVGVLFERFGVDA